MKKSGKVTLGFVAGAAMVLLGCQRSEMQRCVDKYGMVTEDFYCDPARPSTYRNFYHWHYGGSGGFGYGTYVHDGSSIATPKKQTITPAKKNTADKSIAGDLKARLLVSAIAMVESTGAKDREPHTRAEARDRRPS